ncbi:MAG: Enolase [Planctomycetota bacterium]
MPRIDRIYAREVLDSRGNPTVEVEIETVGLVGRAMVPSGASTGSAEALELRDGDPNRYAGRGVRQAVRNVREVIGPAIVGMDACDQQSIDRRLIELDGTPNKSRLGGNAILGVSLATAVAASAARHMPLYLHLNELQVAAGTQAIPAPAVPTPMTNIISGGLHAGGNLDFQDILVMPHNAPDFATGLEWIVRVYREQGRLLCEAGYEGRLVGDEGGYGPRLKSNREAVEFVVRAIEAAGLRPGHDMVIAIDVAATHFAHDSESPGSESPGREYRLASERNRVLSADQMIDQLEHWVDAFPIVSIEDGLAENDWEGWQRLTSRLGSRVQLVGDDLFATNPARLRRGISLHAANSVLIKVNQIGTLTETFEAISIARSAGYGFVVSARSGETEDDFLADLATATAAPSIKIGSVVRSERLAKYNRLLRIAEQLEG